MAANASSHDAESNRSPRLMRGTVSRWNRRPSYAYRALSLIHSSLTSSLVRGWIRITWTPRESTRMFDPTESRTSIDSVFFSSQGLAWNAYGLLVRAPTGHRSTTFPDSSESIVFSTYIPI